MSIDIYDAEITDIPEIIALLKAAIPQEKSHLLRLYTEKSLQQALESDNRYLIVAIVKDKIVGVCQYGIPIMDDCNCEDLRQIQMLYVNPTANYEKIASALVYDVEDTLDQDAGVVRLSLFVNSHDLAKIKFYARLGFVHDLVEDTDDEWYMEKDL